MIEYIGLVWLLVLFFSAWALLGLLRAPVALKAKAIWALIILLLPVVGAAAWIFVGAARTAR